jgi:uncharacterized protein (DUF2267 family)
MTAPQSPAHAPSEEKPLERLVMDVAARAALPSGLAAESAVTATMGALMDRLTPGEAHALMTALPRPIAALLVREVERRDGGPVAPLHRAEYLLRLSERLGVTPIHAEAIAGAVFGAMRAELPAKTIHDVAQQLPRGLKQLWRGEERTGLSPESPTDADEARRALVAEIEGRAALPRGVTGAEAFEAVMCLFSQRLSGGEARVVLLSLPESVRPLVTHCIQHRGEWPVAFDREQMLSRLADHLCTSAVQAEQITRVVFAATKRVLAPKECTDIESQLPPDLRELWSNA